MAKTEGKVFNMEEVKSKDTKTQNFSKNKEQTYKNSKKNESKVEKSHGKEEESKAQSQRV